MRNITPLVAPRSIAVIGASSSPTKSGGILFANLLAGGFSGPLYPINPRSAIVMERKSYATLAEVPEPVDLVYIVLPREGVEQAVEQCIEAKAKVACIIASGFSEANEDGRAHQERLRQRARSAGLLLAGPNTIGMVNTECRMMGSFVNFPNWKSGGVSLFTQTGIFTGAVIMQAMNDPVQALPVSKSIDVGNKIDVDEIDFLHFAATDPGTRVIGLYLESISEPEAFIEIAREIRQTKPIVILKPGRTPPGRIASMAHTGSRQEDDTAFDAELRLHGIVRAEDEEEFLGILRGLALLPRPAGRRVGIATTSGALGVISTDMIARNDLELATFGEATLAAMRSVFPEWLEPTNPYDFWISNELVGPRQAHEVGLEAVFADPDVDMVLCTLLAPANADFPEFGEMIRRLCHSHRKPVAFVIYGGDARTRWVESLQDVEAPIYPSTRAAVQALAGLFKACESIS